MKKLFLILLLTVLSFALLQADVYIKSNTHTSEFEMMGKKQPAKDVVTEQWMGEDKFATISSQQTIIMDMGAKKLYFIFHNNKTYLETDLPFDISKLLPPQAASMMSMMKATATVTPTAETKKIDKWNCTGYDVDMSMAMMQMKMRVWATTDVTFDWKAYSEKMMGVIMKSSMPFLDDKVMDEFKKIKGFQIGSDMTMSAMGSDMKMNTRVTEITSKEAPAGVYSVPEGYTKVDKLPMRGMGM